MKQSRLTQSLAASRMAAVNKIHVHAPGSFTQASCWNASEERRDCDLVMLSRTAVGSMRAGTKMIRRRGAPIGKKEGLFIEGFDMGESDLVGDLFHPGGDAEDSESLFEFQPSSKEHGINPILREFIMATEDSSYETLAEKFRSVPEQMIRYCLDFGIRFYVFDSNTHWDLFDSAKSRAPHSDAGFDPVLKACYIHDHALDNVKLPDLALRALSHALDYAMGKDHYASSQSPLVLGLYRQCALWEPGHAFISEYASKNASNYFAETMGFYFWSEEEFHGRNILKALDKSMFDYQESLIMYYFQRGFGK